MTLQAPEMKAGVLLVSAVVVCSSTRPAGAQGTSQPRPAGVQSADQAGAAVGLTHVGIVVRDIDRAIERMASLTGADKSAIQPADARAQPGLDRAARLRLSNITIEFLQPAADAPGTFRRFVEAQGAGIHHLGLEKGPRSSVKDQTNRLVQLGGKVIVSDPDRAVVDLASRLGPLLEILSPTLHDRLYPAGMPKPRLDPAAPFAQPTCMTHVGIVVRDIEQAQQMYAELLGVDARPIHPLEAATGSARYTFFKLQNVTVELLQQAAGVRGAYADFLGANAQRVHHIGLHLRGRDASYKTVPQQIAWLERHGGRIGVDAKGFAYIDVGLGVFVEALAEESINRVYPCN